MWKLKKIMLSLLVCFLSFNFISAEDSNYKKEIYKNNEKIKELYESEVKLNSEIESIERKLLSVTDQISSHQQIISQHVEKIEEVENNMYKLNKEIEDLNNEVASLEKNITSNLSEISHLEGEVEKFKDIIKIRIRNLYKNVDTYNPIVKIFLTSENINNFREKLTSMNKFIEIDKQVIEKVFENIDSIKSKNFTVENNKNIVQEKIKIINQKIEENDKNLKVLETEKQLKEKEADEINKLSTELKNQYNNLSEEKKLIQEEIIKLHQDNYKIQEELKKYLEKLNENNKAINSKVNYGKYLRPAVGPITSKYGKRVHPITKKESFHSGVDIGGNIGDKVVASLSGEVVSAGWYNNVYGNVVIINHGNNIQTFYGHLNKVLVKKGQEVRQGEIIAKMGTTGLSTGPHVHFEIRINGEHVDPTKRIKF